LYLPGKIIEDQLQTLKTALQKHIELTTIQQDKVWQRRKGFQSLEYEDGKMTISDFWPSTRPKSNRMY
jgi:hypothetical protein